MRRHKSRIRYRDKEPSRRKLYGRRTARKKKKFSKPTRTQEVIRKIRTGWE